MNALRDWWRHRNDPPPMLPDPVRWTTECDRDGLGDLLRKARQEGWGSCTVSDDCTSWALGQDRVRVRFRREDGAYRWRDDAFQGF